MERHEIEQAAIEAEFATGEREASVEAAKRHIVVRLARMGLGFTLLVLGLAMLVLPGPGMLVVAAGLVILAEDIAWADRMLRYVRRKVPGVPEDGRIPRSTLLVGGLLTLAGIAATVWFTTR
jgi:hypothetical protein